MECEVGLKLNNCWPGKQGQYQHIKGHIQLLNNCNILLSTLNIDKEYKLRSLVSNNVPIIDYLFQTSV